MILRRATAADAPPCARIVSDWIKATDWMPDEPSRAKLEQLMRDGFPTREAWLAEQNGDVLGYLSMGAASTHIFGLYVKRPRQGVGRILLNRAKEGRDRLKLRSHSPNHAAHRFYRREGFVTIATELSGDDGVTEIEMEWKR